MSHWASGSMPTGTPKTMQPAVGALALTDFDREWFAASERLRRKRTPRTPAAILAEMEKER